MSKLQRKLKKVLDSKQDRLRAWPGWLGDAEGNVVVDGMPNHVYVRHSNDVVEVAFNTRVAPERDVPVWVGFVAEQPNVAQVIGRRPVNRYGEDQKDQFMVPPHATNHRWMAEGGGTDPVFIEGRQLMPMFIGVVSGFIIGIYSGIVYIDGNWIEVVGEEIDLTSYVPSNGGKGKFVLITVDDLGDFIITSGSEVDVEDLVLTDLPSIPVNTWYVLGAVRLYTGQNSIVETRITTDILDLRWPVMWHSHDDRYTTTSGNTLDSLSDVSAPAASSSDRDVVSYDKASAQWKNRSPEEAGLARHNHIHPSDLHFHDNHGLARELHYHPFQFHDHLEAEITDLDHDAQKIKGVEVDSSAIADQLALKYDSASGKIIYGAAGGGSVEIKEIDGSPDVTGVNIIRVSNGTLTDDSGGQVTLAIPEVAKASAWTFRIDGALTTSTDVAALISTGNAVIGAVYIRCKTLGTANSTIVDVHKNGVTIFTTQANRPTLAWNDADGIAVSGTPDVTSLVAGDLLTVDIDAVATDAADLTVSLDVTIVGAPYLRSTSDILEVQVFS